MNFTLSISCEKENLAKVRGFVEKVLLQNNVEELETHKLVLAVDEICANLIIHSNHCDVNHSIDIVIEIQPKVEVVFVIRDKGIFFDINSYKEPSMDDVIHSKRKGGVGLMLVKRIMDKIEFATEKNYNICRLTKKFR